MSSESTTPAGDLSLTDKQHKDRQESSSEGGHQSTFSSSATLNEPGPFKPSKSFYEWRSRIKTWGNPKQKLEDEKQTPESQDSSHECIEDKFPRGYPSLTAFMDIEPKFDMFRKFGRLHIRTLLNKQDELTELEEQLDLVDSQDETQLFLSSRRYDRNQVRMRLLDKIDKKLAEYDKALLRHHRLVNLKPVAPRNAKSFVNWMEGNRPLIEPETRFMKDLEDFVPSSQQDMDFGFLDSTIEWLLPKLCFGCTCIFSPKVSLRRKSTYKYLHLYSAPRIRRLVRLLITILAVKSLLIPIVLLYYIKESQARLYIVLSFTVGISLMLSVFTNASRYEIFAATAAYCAVLVVFLGSVS